MALTAICVFTAVALGCADSVGEPAHSAGPKAILGFDASIVPPKYRELGGRAAALHLASQVQSLGLKNRALVEMVSRMVERIRSESDAAVMYAGANYEGDASVLSAGEDYEGEYFFWQDGELVAPSGSSASITNPIMTGYMTGPGEAEVVAAFDFVGSEAGMSTE